MVEGSPKIYIRPFGVLFPVDAAREMEAGHALPLAGGPCAFSFLEIIQRHPDGHITRRSVRVSDMSSMGLLVGDETLRRLTDPRQDIAGLSFDQPRLMGVLNVTPDSFSDGGRFATPQDAVEAGKALAAAGADVIDIGGESTRPGAEPVAAEEELARVRPVVEALAGSGIGVVSIDTRKAAVFEAAFQAGARVLNDVSALTYDAASLPAAARAGVGVILMHARGEPQTMQNDPVYDHVLLDVYDALEERIAACEAAGLSRAHIIVDPGLGFGKTVDHNLDLLAGVGLFHALGCPLMLGASRKSFIGAVDSGAEVGERLPGSLAALVHGLANGVQLFRVHDVAEARQALRLWQAINAKRQIY